MARFKSVPTIDVLTKQENLYQKCNFYSHKNIENCNNTGDYVMKIYVYVHLKSVSKVRHVI